MALPALVGLSALGGLISSLLTKSVELLFSRLAKRIAILTIVVAGIYAAIYALLTFIGSTLKPLIQSLPSEVTSLMGAALPSNTTTCLAAVVATQIACLTYKLTMKSLEMQTKVV